MKKALYWFIFCMIVITSYLVAESVFPKIYAHRGYQLIYPENSLPGIRYCTQLPIDAIDMDVVLTKDRMVIVYHDLILNRWTTKDPLDQWIKGTRYIASLYLNDIKKYDIGHCHPQSIIHQLFPYQRNIPNLTIPTLEEALCILVHYDKTIQIEIKDPQAAPYVVELIERFELDKRIEVQTNSQQVVSTIQSLNSHIPISYLVHPFNQDELLKHINTAIDLGVAIVGPEHTYLDKEIIQYCHQHGLKVVTWTVNEINRMKALIEMKVDGIITDYPKDLLSLKS